MLNMEHMEIVVFSFVAATSGACFTSIGCRRARVQHRRPGWHLALLCLLVTVLLTILYVGRADLFHPDRWDDYKGGFWPPVVFASASAAGVALLSSLVAVYYFRAKFRNEKPEAQQSACT
jgi:hypothetical protein